MSKIRSSYSQSGIVFVTLIIVLAVVGLGAGAVYYFTDGFGRNKTSEGTKAEPKAPASEGNNNDQINESATGQDTLPLVKLALQGKGSVKCTADSMIEGKHAISTIYIKDENRYRLEIRTDMGTVNTLILDQKTGYTWAEQEKTGTKITLGKDDKTIEEQWQENIDYVENNSDKSGADTPRLSCDQTAVDDSLFTLPSDVKFSDLSPYTVD